MTTTSIESLADALPPGVVSRDPATLARYRHDATSETAGTPLAVVCPEDSDQVQLVMRWAHENGVAVVPRGAGSGVSGGSSALDGALTLSLERMRAIEIDPASRIAIVQPGAFNAEVKAAAAEFGLWYPPDPSSFEICSIGGNIATNAGGLCCVKYGVTTDYVLGLDVVLADGTRVSLGGSQIKDVAGLSLVKLFVGSEGTLGVVTRAILRLIPAQPEKTTLIATFDTVEAAAESVVGIGRMLRPSMMELMDRASINAVEDHLPSGLDRDAEAMLIAQSDAPGALGEAEIAEMLAVFVEHGARETILATDPVVAERYTAARRAVFPALMARGRLMYGDVGVKIPLLPELLAGIAAIGERHRIDVSVCAHAGDGNTHPNVVFDPSVPGMAVRAQQAFTEIMDLAIALGGTITGEHGVGRAKRHRLPDQLGPDVMALNRAIKNALDPAGILNPGVMF
ncbi:MAG: FAD-binding protein [Microbacteriaceae bacterium]|nr:MAG: FAD-binding protein [Microbacteriaceae bacterium]